MKLQSITVEGFRSFIKPQTFTFPEGPGLFFMQGLNKSEPRLGANGAGKSTVWEALLWVIYGKTSRGLKAGDVGNWHMGKGTRVSLCFKSDQGNGLIYQVERTWKPNTWVMNDLFGKTWDLTTDSTNHLLAWLGLEFTTFLNCVLMAQGQGMFLDLKAEPKAQLFSDVMGLDKWLEFAERASKKASAQDLITRRLEREQAELKGQLSGTGHQDLERSEKEWKARQNERMAESEDRHAIHMRRADLSKKKLSELQAQEKKTREAFAVADTALAAAEEGLKVADKKLDEVNAKHTHWCKVRDRAEDELRRGRHAKNCPTCGQSWSGAKAHLTEVMEEAEVFLTEKEDLRAAAVAELKVWEKAADYESGKLARAKAALDDLLADIRGADIELLGQEKQLDRIEDEYEQLSHEQNPFAKMLDQRRQEVADLHLKAEKLADQLDSSTERYALLSYWVKGFKEVRLKQIGSALEELEIEVNSEVMKLGLVDWELRFDVDKETKGGSLTRGFSVSVISPHNAKAVPWEAWSGGESQRLRLAAQQGLANLIRDRTGATIDLEVWDEPTKELSEEGVTDLLNALSDRAKREQRQIWIVDHRSLGYGGFDGGITVVKDEAGSRFQKGRV